MCDKNDKANSNEQLASVEPQAVAASRDDPPVVARMVVEIRSDGTRTIARGALQDVSSGEQVAVEARGTTPMALAASLAKTMFAAPALARHAVRALIQSRLGRRDRGHDADGSGTSR